MREEIKKIMALVFSIDQGSIDDKFAYGEHENWDSIHHLNLIVELESHFHVIFEPEDIQVMLDIDTIIDHIIQKQS